jgi:sulfoacetaldehyde dehydrogenase
MRTVRTVGVVEEDPERGLVKIAKPVGVVAAIVPTTGPDATPPVKALLALKGRNAIVVKTASRARVVSTMVSMSARRCSGTTATTSTSTS